MPDEVSSLTHSPKKEVGSFPDMPGWMERRNPIEWSGAIRQDILDWVTRRIGHPACTGLHTSLSADPASPHCVGESLAAVDILTVMHLEQLSLRPSVPAWEDRDRFVFGIPAAWPAYRAILARLGFFPYHASDELPFDMNMSPGVDFSSAVSGVALAAATGMAMGFQEMKRPLRVFTIFGSEDMDRGRTWEAAAVCGQKKLSGLCAVVECRATASADEATTATMAAEKFRSFGWEPITVDGHAVDELRYAFHKFRKGPGVRPTVIAARTMFGRGIPPVKDLASVIGEERFRNVAAFLSEQANQHPRG